MNRFNMLINAILANIEYGEFDEELGFYKSCKFKANGITYYIDALKWRIYRVNKYGKLIPVRYTVAQDKCTYLITNIGKVQVKIHRLFAVLLLKDGVEKLINNTGYSVNHRMIPSYWGDLEYGTILNRPIMLEIVTDKQNYKHRKFVYDNGLRGVPIAYKDIEIFERMFKDLNIKVEDRHDFVVNAYKKRVAGIKEYACLSNLNKY